MALLFASSAAFADTYVNGYTKSDGTQVQGYERTNPNSTRSDNYSTQGNTNPYTGQAGTQSLTPPTQTYTPPVYTPAPVYRPKY